MPCKALSILSVQHTWLVRSLALQAKDASGSIPLSHPCPPAVLIASQAPRVNVSAPLQAALQGLAYVLYQSSKHQDKQAVFNVPTVCAQIVLAADTESTAVFATGCTIRMKGSEQHSLCKRTLLKSSAAHIS